MEASLKLFCSLSLLVNVYSSVNSRHHHHYHDQLNNNKVLFHVLLFSFFLFLSQLTFDTDLSFLKNSYHKHSPQKSTILILTTRAVTLQRATPQPSSVFLLIQFIDQQKIILQVNYIMKASSSHQQLHMKSSPVLLLSVAASSSTSSSISNCGDHDEEIGGDCGIEQVIVLSIFQKPLSSRTNKSSRRYKI